MLDINKVTQEISNCLSSMDNDGLTKGQISKVKNRINFLKIVIRYLESGPSTEFLKKEISRLTNRIQLINDQFADYLPTQYFEKEKDKLKHYLKECGVPKLKIQLKALRFIYNS